MISDQPNPNDSWHYSPNIRPRYRALQLSTIWLSFTTSVPPEGTSVGCGSNRGSKVADLHEGSVKKGCEKKMPREVIKREWGAMRCLLIFFGGWRYVFVLKVKGVLLFCSFLLSNVIIDFEEYPLPPRRSQLIQLVFNHMLVAPQQIKWFRQLVAYNPTKTWVCWSICILKVLVLFRQASSWYTLHPHQ